MKAWTSYKHVQEQGRSSPLTSQLETKWERVSQEEQTFFIGKATEACKIVCSAITPEDGKALFEAVCKTDGSDVQNELRPLLEAYRDAPSKDTKTQILSIYANRYPAKKLMEIHKLYEQLTELELRKAKLHANNKGLGAPLEKPLYHRAGLIQSKSTISWNL